MLTEERVLHVLKDVNDPELNKSLVELNMIRNIQINNNQVDLEVVLTIKGCPLKYKIQTDVEKAIKAAGAEEVRVRFGSMTDDERKVLSNNLRKEQKATREEHPSLSANKSIEFISIVSGKGGVGKSTVTVNLAVALARAGKKVGIIDADIYGFSIPSMMGIEQRPVVIDETILPVEQHGVKVMSMGFFIQDNAPVIWRGPMLGKMLRNFLTEVYWGDLDYVLLDMPPGTGDVALDVYQMIPQCRQIIVTTPHSTAAFVAARAGTMALQTTKQQLLGVIENMAWYERPDGQKDYVFGQCGGEVLAKELQVDLLAQIPLGLPNKEKDSFKAIYNEDSPIAVMYDRLARTLMDKILVNV